MTTRKRLYGPALLTSSTATKYTVPADTQTELSQLHIANETASNAALTASIGADAVGTRIVDAEIIPAHSTRDYWFRNGVIEVGEIVAANADVNSALTMTLWGTETPLVTAATPGAAVVRGPFSFAYNTASLTTGVTFYTPTVGDFLLDAWITVDTAFNGTTPLADIGTFVASSAGLFTDVGGVPLSAADAEPTGTGLRLIGPNASLQGEGNAIAAGRVPILFTAANPLKLVVSQTGAQGGAAIGGSTGAARLWIVTARALAF